MKKITIQIDVTLPNDHKEYEIDKLLTGAIESVGGEVEDFHPFGETKYYALYDLQIRGFKAGHASTRYQAVVSSGAQRAFDLSEGDEEPASADSSDVELLEQYGYEVREVSEKDYLTILNSDEIGLLTSVDLKK